MINNENFKNNSNKSINKENINKLNLINNNKTVNKNDFSIKGKSGITSENEFNKKIENNSCNNEDHIDNNNIYKNKKKLSEINSGYYSKIWNVAEAVLKRTQIRKISVFVIDWKADGTSESDWLGSQKAGGNTYGTDGRKTSRRSAK